jgi:hypothetical protein
MRCHACGAVAPSPKFDPGEVLRYQVENALAVLKNATTDSARRAGAERLREATDNLTRFLLEQDGVGSSVVAQPPARR